MRRIEKFLDIYPNKGTVNVYRAGIYDFLDCLFGRLRKGRRATKEEREKYEDLADRYFTEDRNHFEAMLSFYKYLHEKPPRGAKAKISGVHEFLSFNEVEFSQRERKMLATKLPKGKMARTAEKDVDVEKLKKILTHVDVKGKAVVLTLASSGARIGELLQVSLSDVDLNSTPPELVIRGENSKAGDTRTIFITQEAKEAVTEWLKVRYGYLNSSKDRSRGLGRAKENAGTDERLFPFTDANVRTMWGNALKKAGLWTKDNSTGLSQVRIHGLRKFFRSQLALSCPLDIVEALMGHEGYLTDAYRRYTQKQMGEYYLKAQHHVTVMGSGDIRDIQDRLQDTQAAVKGYKDIITEQAEEIVDLRRRVESLETTRRKINEVDESFPKIMEDPEVKNLLMKKIKDMMKE